MKIATWSVNGIRARQSQLAEWVATERPDIICLQEIKATLEQVPVMDDDTGDGSGRASVRREPGG